jgi:hypothetical protein
MVHSNCNLKRGLSRKVKDDRSLIEKWITNSTTHYGCEDIAMRCCQAPQSKDQTIPVYVIESSSISRSSA